MQTEIEGVAQEVVWRTGPESATLADGAMVGCRIGKWSILLARVGGSVRAVIDRCSHAASPLHGGRLRGSVLLCPLHGARFDIVSGQAVGAAYPPLKTFAVEERDGMIWIAVPDCPPAAEHIPISPR